MLCFSFGYGLGKLLYLVLFFISSEVWKCVWPRNFQQGSKTCRGCIMVQEILAETWGCKCDISFDNYIPHYVSPQKHLGVRKGRSSVGFTILIKPYLAKSVNILKMSNNFVWMEIDKKVVNNIQENLIVVGTYINDITSTYYDDKNF